MSDASDEQYGASFVRPGDDREERAPQGGSLRDTGRKHHTERRRVEEEEDEEQEEEEDEREDDDEEEDDDDEGAYRGGKRQKVGRAVLHECSAHDTDSSASADTSAPPLTGSLM